MMKKAFKFYFAVWAVLLALFNVIAFVSVGWAGIEKYTPAFWIGYIFITLAFIGQLACAYYALKGDDVKKTFYNISLITTSYSGLIVSFIVGGLCMLISPLPYWIAVILCAVVLAFSVMAVIKASAAVEIVNDVDKKVKESTLFIKSLTVDAESLLSRAKSEEAKAACKKVYEAARYSDPVSCDALASAESEITIKFSQLSEDVTKNDLEQISSLADELVVLIGDRNRKCKLLK